MASISDLNKGSVIIMNGAPHLLTEYQHVNPGKGSAFVRTKLKHLMTGKTAEHTFKASETVEEAFVTRKNVQYLYHNESNAYFMDLESYEQFQLPLGSTPGLVDYILDGSNVILVSLDDKPLTIDIPRKVELKVTMAEPAVKGDTAGGNVTKEAKLETGITIRVPMFIKEGEIVRINTVDGAYVERATS